MTRLSEEQALALADLRAEIARTREAAMSTVLRIGCEPSEWERIAALEARLEESVSLATHYQARAEALGQRCDELELQRNVARWRLCRLKSGLPDIEDGEAQERIADMERQAEIDELRLANRFLTAAVGQRDSIIETLRRRAGFSSDEA